MAGARSFIRDHYVSEYFNNAAEPHRQRPAIVDFPCTVWHVGVYHKDTSEERRAFLEEVKAKLPKLLAGWRVVRWSSDPEKGFGPAPGEPLDEEFLDRFFNQPWFRGDAAPDPKARKPTSPIDKWTDPAPPRDRDEDTVFCFECVPDNHTLWTLRFDLHTEYFTFTMITRFDVEGAPDRRPKITTYHWDGTDARGWCRRVTDLSAPQQPGKLNDPLQIAFRHAFVAPPDLPVDAETGPICEALRAIISESGKNVFCDFRGVITDWRLFQGHLGENTTNMPPVMDPDLCEEMFCGFTEPRDHSPTQNFLSRLWPSLNGTIFAKASENVVGCYMQNGHAIYLSALGAQGLPPKGDEQLSPVTFLLVYAAPKEAARNGNPHRWRLSRLVNRLLEVGTRRVASLRHLHELRQASSNIGDLENTLDGWSERQALRHRPLMDQLERLDRIHDAVGGSLSYRTHRAGRHHAVMMTLIEDLGIRAIPGWLPYDEFVNRRLSGTHDTIANLVPRMQALEDRIRVRLQELDSSASQQIALIGTLAAAIAATYWVADLMAVRKFPDLAGPAIWIVRFIRDLGWLDLADFMEAPVAWFVASGLRGIVEGGLRYAFGILATVLLLLAGARIYRWLLAARDVIYRWLLPVRKVFYRLVGR